MYITNIWGIFFCFYLPVLITIYIAYEAGYADAKNKYQRRRYKRQYSKENKNNKGG